MHTTDLHTSTTQRIERHILRSQLTLKKYKLIALCPHLCITTVISPYCKVISLTSVQCELGPPLSCPCETLATGTRWCWGTDSEDVARYAGGEEERLCPIEIDSANAVNSCWNDVSLSEWGEVRCRRRACKREE